MTTGIRRRLTVSATAVLAGAIVFGGVLSSPFTENANAATASFQVDVNNGSSAYTVPCVQQSGTTDDYGTSITTERSASLWVPDPTYTDDWRLGFQYSGSGDALGGRCATGTTSTFTGSGDFTGRVYIDSNVADSIGVFTIGMLQNTGDTTTDQAHELDLFVANVASNTLKMGTPNEAASETLGDIDQQWITLHVEKRGSTCHFFIDKANGTRVWLTHQTCATPSSSGAIIVNARARNGSSTQSGYITVDQVGWTVRSASDAFTPSS